MTLTLSNFLKKLIKSTLTPCIENPNWLILFKAHIVLLTSYTGFNKIKKINIFNFINKDF